MKKILFIACFASLVLTLTMCNDKQSYTPKVSGEFEISSLKVKNPSQSNSQLVPIGGPIVILTWESWGRAARDCRGFGLCHVVWFPDSVAMMMSAPVFKDESTGKYYMHILLDSPIPEPIPAEIRNLYVDNTIEIKTLSVFGKNIKILGNSSFPYISTLGEYGGYIVELI